MKDPDDLGQMVTGDYSLVDELADQLEQAWQSAPGSTSGVDLAPLLPAVGNPLRMHALHELVKTDLSCRWQRGLTTSLEEYVQKFPELASGENLTAKLIYEEFRIRTLHGVNTPLEAYKSRFPGQFADFEKLVTESFVTQAGGKTTPLSRSPAPSSSASMSSGYVVGGHYTLLKRIGSGGFGEVWRATDTHGGIDKGVKILSRPLESEEAKTELKALDIIKTLNHPYLLRTEGFFVEQDRLIIVMELADASLRDVLKTAKEAKKSAVSPKELLTYMRHSAEALDYLHAQGIVHRDIKPENILLVGKIAKLADFGLARLMSNRRSTMTNFAGTGAYSPPETWKGKLTTFSDQYALAVTYGELRLGRMVYKARTIFEFMTAHLTERPALDPLPHEEQEILLRALAKEPKARFGTCTEFVEELMRVALGDAAPPPRRPAPPPPQPLIDAGMLDEESSLRATRKGASDPLADEDSLGTVRVPSNNSTRPSPTPSSPKRTEPAVSRKPTVAMPKAGPTAAIPKATSTRTQTASWSSKRAKRGKGGLVAVVVMLLALGGSAAAMFMAKSSLQGTVQANLDKRDYAAAFDAIKVSGPLVAPFRAGILEETRTKTLDDAKRLEREGDLTELEKPCTALLTHFPDDPTALEMLEKCLMPVLDGQIAKGQYSAAYQQWKKTPDSLSSKATAMQRLQKRWLDDAKRDLKEHKFAKAQETALAFLGSFQGHAEASVIQQQAAAGEKVESLLQEKKFADARKAVPTSLADSGALANQVSKALETHFKDLLAKNPDEARREFQRSVGEFPVLRSFVEPLKADWAKKEEKSFQEASDETTKEAALANVNALLQSFPKDQQIEPLHDKMKEGLFDFLKNRGDQAKQEKRYAEAARLWAKANSHGKSATELQPQIKVAEVLGRLQQPLTDAASIGEVRDRLQDLLDSKADGLGDVAKVCVEVANANSDFRSGIAEQIKQFDRFLPNSLLDQAKKSLEKGEFIQALAQLDGVDLARVESKADLSNLFALYADVGEKTPLSRKGLATLAKHLKGADKARYEKIVTRFIEKNALEWPSTSEDTWASRLQESADADPANPAVQAYKAEAELELHQADKIKPIVFTSSYSNALRPYADFIQARIDLSHSKPLEGVKRLETMKDKEPWLNGKRYEQLAQIYHGAATSLKKDGAFAQPEDADQAYEWMGQAQRWLKKSLGAGKELTPKDWPMPMQQTYALAAASKALPNFELSKKLTDDLLPSANPKDNDVTTLLLTQAHLFGKELRERIKSKVLTLPMAEKQIAMNEKISKNLTGDLRKRQAWLLAIVGDLNRQASNRIKAFDSYEEAAKLEPKDREIVLAYAIVGADFYVIESRESRAREDRVRMLREALKITDGAIKLDATKEPAWPEVLLFRSMICLELGNHLNFALTGVEKDNKEKKKEWHDLIAEALKYAQKAKDTGAHPRPGDVELALGNSHEDMARFVESEPEKNFPLSMDAFGEAKKYVLDKGGVGRGRCAYRWAVAGGERDKLLKEAEKELKPIGSRKDSPESPEAQFWLGRVYQEQRDYPGAFTALLESLELALKQNAPDWSTEAGNQLVKVLFLQRDAKVAADWSKKFFASAKKMKRTDPLLASNWIATVANQRALAFILAKDGGAAAAAFEEALPEVPTQPKANNTATGHVALLSNLAYFRMFSGAAAKLTPTWGKQEFIDISDRIEQTAQALESGNDTRKDEPESRRVRAEAWFTAASIQSKYGTLDKEEQYWARATAAKHPTKLAEVNYGRIGFLLQKAKNKNEKELVRLAEEALERIDDDKDMSPQVRVRYISELQQVIDQYKKK